MQIVHPPRPRVTVQPLPDQLAGLGRTPTGPRMIPMTADYLNGMPDEGPPWAWIIATIIATLVVVSLVKNAQKADA